MTILRGHPHARDAAAAASILMAGLAATWLLRLPWILANVLVFGLPAAYLLATSEVPRRRVSWVFTALLAGFGVSTLGFIGELYGGGRSVTILPWRFAGGVVFEEIEWTALFFAGILTVNERFFATRAMAPTRLWAKVWLIASFYVTLLVVAVPELNAPFRDHVYIKACPPVQLPVIVVALLVNPPVWRELLRIAAVVTPCMLAFEVVALHAGYWSFGGQYIGTVSAAGYRFPIEELLFMIVLSGPSVVSSHTIWKNWRLGRRHGRAEAATAGVGRPA